MTNTSAVLSWSPAVNGGGRPLSEIVYTITAVGEYREICHHGVCGLIVIPIFHLFVKMLSNFLFILCISTLIQSNMYSQTQRMEEE